MKKLLITLLVISTIGALNAASHYHEKQAAEWARNNYASCVYVDDDVLMAQTQRGKIKYRGPGNFHRWDSNNINKILLNR